MINWSKGNPVNMPFWQHFAGVVRIGEEPDGEHVKLIVARIIPGRTVDDA